MSDAHRTTRRSFIKSATATGAAVLITGLPGCGPQRSAKVTPTFARKPPGGKLRVAFIGTGGIGEWHLTKAAELGCVCPCYCDVDARRMAKARELFPDARTYQDYRRMIDDEHRNFDAVMVGTPDHHHYPATMLAIKHGKHVYTQKPLTYTVEEARELADAAREHGVASQMGNQGHAKEGWRLLYEWVHSGAIGDVTEVHVWTNRPVWPQGMQRPEAIDVVPDSLNWDAWLGPAPERPYVKNAYHPFNWRGWWDFGAGALGDMACHTMDGVWAVLDPGHPTAVEPLAATPLTAEAFPEAAIVRWEFPAKRGRPAFVVYWYDGGLKPPKPPQLEPGRELPQTGNLFLGTDGAILVSGDYVDSPRIIPEKRMREIGKPPRMLERSPGHAEEWVMAASGEKAVDYPKSNFSYAGPFTEAVLLGNVALRARRRLEWDGPGLRVTNVPEANEFIGRAARSGWRV